MRISISFSCRASCEVVLRGICCIVFSFLFFIGCFLAPSLVGASEVLNTTTASRIVLEDTGAIQGGDIVSYTPSDGLYRLSKTFSDEHMFGVVITSPVLLMGAENEYASNTLPVVRAGEVVVNVSDVMGAIYAGDLITTSGYFFGTGERADRAKPVFILGFALKDATFGDPETGFSATTSVRFGTVPVSLRIGQYVPGKDVATEHSATSSKGEGLYGVDYFSMFRYALGAIIALAGVIVALRRFGDMFTQGVVSVGRNPLARTQIRSMMLWNSLLILLTGGLAFGVGMTIIFW